MVKPTGPDGRPGNDCKRMTALLLALDTAIDSDWLSDLTDVLYREALLRARDDWRRGTAERQPTPREPQHIHHLGLNRLGRAGPSTDGATRSDPTESNKSPGPQH